MVAARNSDCPCTLSLLVIFVCLPICSVTWLDNISEASFLCPVKSQMLLLRGSLGHAHSYSDDSGFIGLSFDFFSDLSGKLPASVVNNSVIGLY